MFRADNNTGRFESHIQTMSAESTLGGSIRFGIEIDRVVGTGLHAGFAADTNGRIELDDAVITLIHRSDGADAHARRVDAVIAARNLKAAAHIRVRTRLNIFDPSAVHAKRYLVLRLARSRTGMTSDALALVNEKAVILCHEIL